MDQIWPHESGPTGVPNLEVPTMLINLISKAYVRENPNKIWPEIWYSTSILVSINSHWNTCKPSMSWCINQSLSLLLGRMHISTVLNLSLCSKSWHVQGAMRIHQWQFPHRNLMRHASCSSIHKSIQADTNGMSYYWIWCDQPILGWTNRNTQVAHMDH